MEVTFISRCPSVPLVLLALISFLAGIITSQELTPRHRVNGILGGSVLLSVDPSHKGKMKSIEWSFRVGKGEKMQLAEFNGRIFVRPSNRFQQRLEMKNEISLRIKALELGNSGVYEARIKTEPAIVEDWTLLLTVYEPVPVPEIRSHLLSSMAAGCNVTLQCLVPGGEGVNVSWRRGSPLRDLGDLERYQLSPDGRSLQLSLPPNPPDCNFTCTASNPADQKSTSLDLPSICQSRGADTPFSNLRCIVLTSFLLVLTLGTAVWCWRMNKKSVDPGARGGGVSELRKGFDVHHGPPLPL